MQEGSMFETTATGKDITDRIKRFREHGIPGPYLVMKRAHGDGTIHALRELFDYSYRLSIMSSLDIPIMRSDHVLKRCCLYDLAECIPFQEVIDALYEMWFDGLLNDSIIVVSPEILDRLDYACWSRWAHVNFTSVVTKRVICIDESGSKADHETLDKWHQALKKFTEDREFIIPTTRPPPLHRRIHRPDHNLVIFDSTYQLFDEGSTE
jgi:hypothetical protein